MGLSKETPIGRRIFLTFWLTACTYPIVILVLPIVLDASNNRMHYLFVAESFAVVTECILFVWVCKPKFEGLLWRDLMVIAGANMASFLVGEIWWLQ
jgi:hypothetical protein